MSRYDYANWEDAPEGFEFWSDWVRAINFWAGPACAIPEGMRR